MYRCQTCNKRTEDIDDVPCDPKDHPFVPQKIVTLHRWYDDPEKGRIILCTGNLPKPGTQAIGGNYGITCMRCKDKIQEMFFSSEDAQAPKAETKKKKRKTQKPPPEPKLDEEVAGLPDSTDGDKIPESTDS